MPIRSPVNDPGPVATAKTSTSAKPHAAVLEQGHQIERQTSGRRKRRVAGLFAHHDSVNGERAAAAGRGGVEGQDDHGGIIVTFGSRPRSKPAERPGEPSRAHMPPTATATPAMRQYLDAKRQYRDAIVFFRMGDFYEMFYEDALVAARALELTLTSRSKDAGGNGIPMCGVPFHAADGYIARLVKKGFRVAICEQVEDPEEGQGAGPARSRPRRVAGDAHRCQLSRGARAGVPDGDCCVRLARVGRSAPRLIDLSTGEFSAAEYHGPAGLRGAGRRSCRAAAARDRRFE